MGFSSIAQRYASLANRVVLVEQFWCTQFYNFLRKKGILRLNEKYEFKHLKMFWSFCNQDPAVVAEWSMGHVLYCLITSHHQQTPVRILLEDKYGPYVYGHLFTCYIIYSLLILMELSIDFPGRSHVVTGIHKPGMEKPRFNRDYTFPKSSGLVKIVKLI